MAAAVAVAIEVDVVVAVVLAAVVAAVAMVAPVCTPSLGHVRSPQARAATDSARPNRPGNAGVLDTAWRTAKREGVIKLSIGMGQAGRGGREPRRPGAIGARFTPLIRDEARGYPEFHEANGSRHRRAGGGTPALEPPRSRSASSRGTPGIRDHSRARQKPEFAAWKPMPSRASERRSRRTSRNSSPAWASGPMSRTRTPPSRWERIVVSGSTAGPPIWEAARLPVWLPDDDGRPTRPVHLISANTGTTTILLRGNGETLRKVVVVPVVHVRAPGLELAQLCKDRDEIGHCGLPGGGVLASWCGCDSVFRVA